MQSILVPPCVLAAMLASLVLVVGASCRAKPVEVVVGTEKTLRDVPLLRMEDVDDSINAYVSGRRYRVRYSDKDLQHGAGQPLVTIVEFSDFQCPYCVRLADVLREVAAEYPNEVKLVFRNFPFPTHEQALSAAKAALAANAQGRGWAMHDLLFDNHEELGNDQWLDYAKQVGVPDLLRFERELEGDTYEAQIEADIALGRDFSVSSTPSFFVNGRPQKGAKKSAALRVIVEEEIVFAKRLLAKGARRNEVYARIMKAAQVERAAPKPSPRSGRPDPALNYAVPTDGRPSLGPADALVTIVEFSDFQCPYCRKAAESLQEVREQRPDVRIVFRHQPLAFHKRAEPAARAATAAGLQGKFWEMHDKLFGSVKDLSDPNIVRWAREIGLDMAQFRSDLVGDGVKRMVQEDSAVATRFGAVGTPSFFVNGRYMSGAQPVANFVSMIDVEQERAAAFMKAKGVDRSDLYAKMTQEFLSELKRAEVPTSKPAADHRRRDVGSEGLPSAGTLQEPKITIVECSDFDCPFCKRGSARMKDILKEYDGKVALYWRHYPLAMHKQAEPAHRAAVAAERQGKFWEMHELLFAHQQQRGDEVLVSFAKRLGLHVDQFRRDFSDPLTAKRVAQDMGACRKLGVRGAPGFLINGRLMNGLHPMKRFREVLDEELRGGFETSVQPGVVASGVAPTTGQGSGAGEE
ncbi:MAG: thioredoxin domain-containing protein [Nannocystaceae bacterium]